MPFDGSENPYELEKDIILKRRQDAIDLWKTIPDEKFNIRAYSRGCGTIACAIGWLAKFEHDDWFMYLGEPCNTKFATRVDIYKSNFNVINHVAWYFGLTEHEASNLFCYINGMYVFYKRPLQDIKLTHVIAALESMPITIPENTKIIA